MRNDPDESARCKEAEKILRIHQAFRDGDLGALRAAVDDPAIIPNGFIAPAIGSCLVFATYHSPVAFIRTLLELGADPNAPVNDGFPPLIAALSCTRGGVATARDDVDEIIRLLLSFGADPDQRGINDFTPLHQAVAERNALAVQRLLDAGADPDLRTRIDDCETPLEMAQTNGLADLAAILARRGAPLNQRLRSDLTLLLDISGDGEPVRRRGRYMLRLRFQLNHGEQVQWRAASGAVGVSRLEDNGETLISGVRIDRHSLIAGVFYGVEGMRIGGVRRLRIGPSLAYGASGVPDIIPPNAVLVAEITVMRSLDEPS